MQDRNYEILTIFMEMTDQNVRHMKTQIMQILEHKYLAKQIKPSILYINCGNEGKYNDL